MTCVLYKDAPSADFATNDANAGLVFEKFVEMRLSGRIDTGDVALKINLDDDWYKRVCASVKHSPIVTEYVARLLTLMHHLGGYWGAFKATSSFVSGLGNSHPTENGMVWHPTLGLPYLPASSLKGFMRAAAAAQGCDQGWDKEEIKRIFGAQPSDVACQAHVQFFDAIPIQAPSLQWDVLTPHYANWTPEDPPGDWRSPIPIKFLVVNEAVLLISFVVDANYPERTRVQEKLMHLLTEGLCSYGIGAKVNVGYGRFEPELKEQKRLEHELADLIPRDPIEQLYEDLKGKTEQEMFAEVFCKLSSTHHDFLQEPEERRIYARAVLKLGYPESHWRHGKAKGPVSGGSDKIKQRYDLLVAATEERVDGAHGTPP